MDAGFERIDRDLRDLRSELRSELREGLGSVRGEMESMRSDLGGQIEALRHTMLQVGGGMLIALLGVIAAILARGA
jgi:hypothetical protein